MTLQDWVMVNVYPNIYKALAGIFGGMPTYPHQMSYMVLADMLQRNPCDVTLTSHSFVPCKMCSNVYVLVLQKWSQPSPFSYS